MPVKIQYLSDLHLERLAYTFTITPSAPTLILAGDIGLLRDYDEYLTFLRTQCIQFERVLLVPGNHEFYHTSRAEGLEAAQRMAQDPALEARLTVMDRTSAELGDDVVVLGCTLHSNIGPDYTRLTNDFQYIRDWSVMQHNAEHAKDAAWLRQSLAELHKTSSQKRVLVVTHYAPSFDRTCHPAHTKGELSQCFCSDVLEQLGDWEGAEMVKWWVFGHTHWNARFTFRHKKGSVAVAGNQRYCEANGMSRWRRWRSRFREFDGEGVVEV